MILRPPDLTSRIAPADIPRFALTDRAMIVSLRLSAWGAQRLDRKVTREVLSDRNADQDAGRFEKTLVPPKALEGVTRAHSSARARHHALTLPWGESTRILSAAAFMEHATAMAQERAACERAYGEFCNAYPDLLAGAPARLQSLYNASDFPPADRIAEKFGFRVVVMPVPDGNDFRVQLGEEIEAEIRSAIEGTVVERYSEAQRELWGRLLDTVKHFAETMADEGKKFQNTTVTKLGEIAAIAPKLSLTPDPHLDAICAEIAAITEDIDAPALRVSKALRRKAAADAQLAVEQIEEKLRGAFI